MQKNTTTKMQCITCKLVLPRSKFRKYKKKSSFGYRRYCRKCESKAADLRYQHKKNQSNIEKKMQCITCKQVLPSSKFRQYKTTGGHFSYRRYCRKCEAAAAIRRYHQKKEEKEEEAQKDYPFKLMDLYRKVKGT